MATVLSNAFKTEVMDGTVTGTTDTFKIILMQSGFSFNQATHSTYADVSASELPTASGYTVGGNTLAGVALTQDNSLNAGRLTWNNTTWTASGGNIVAAGAIIFDDTVTSPADLVVGYIDFGSDQTTVDGGTFTIANIEVRIA